MNASAYWNWLTQFIELLEIQTQKASITPDPKRLAELRLAERTLNACLDQFSVFVEETEGKWANVFVREQYEGQDAWNDLKRRRDEIANTLANLIESNPVITARYEEYCEALKNPRAISAML